MNYRDEVLEPIVVPFIRNDPWVTVLQQDNTRAHLLHASMDFLQAQNLEVKPLPSLLPDLSPIEDI